MSTNYLQELLLSCEKWAKHGQVGSNWNQAHGSLITHFKNIIKARKSVDQYYRNDNSYDWSTRMIFQYIYIYSLDMWEMWDSTNNQNAFINWHKFKILESTTQTINNKQCQRYRWTCEINRRVFHQWGKQVIYWGLTTH